MFNNQLCKQLYNNIILFCCHHASIAVSLAVSSQTAHSISKFLLVMPSWLFSLTDKHQNRLLVFFLKKNSTYQFMAKFSLTSNLLPVTSVYAFRCLIIQCIATFWWLVWYVLWIIFNVFGLFSMVGCYIWWGIDKVTTCTELMYSKAPLLTVSPSDLEASFSMLILRQECGKSWW